MSIELLLFCLETLKRECVYDDQPRNAIEAVTEAAEEYNVPIDLAIAMAVQESRLDCHATSRSGARGVLQVMPKTAEYIGFNPSRLHECEHGARAGIHYLSMMLKKCDNDYHCVLTSYNCGPNCRNPDNKETTTYRRNIMRMLR